MIRKSRRPCGASEFGGKFDPGCRAEVSDDVRKQRQLVFLRPQQILESNQMTLRPF